MPAADPAAPDAASPPLASLATAPATTHAIIIFANIPGARCGTCDTLKLSLAPSGQVLIERGSWTSGHGNWRYRRARANVGTDRAAAFAASLSADRPSGTARIGSAGCPTPRDGLSIEWVEADRHDVLTIAAGCPEGGGGQVAERLRHAPDLLGLRQLAWP